ncbi:HTH domain-containing protein [Carnimonas bestiolae]|uniref:HTH domain-containing protein n=1 Tax=Carnimonas bestiolae TaxID=3402172 RepID=UPI003EDC1363
MKDMPWKQAVEQVLRNTSSVMNRTEIADAIIAEKLRINVGATPAHTVAATLSMSIDKDGDASPFFRVRRGEYMLRELVDSTAHSSAALEQNVRYEENEESEAGGIKAFGVYWARDRVNWQRKPKLLGQQQIAAEAVDMCDQIGIYLLYDGREAIYVGRSIDRPLGIRLYEHTLDRLRGRWDRFSWFGLYDITSDGQLSDKRLDADPESLIRAMEAVLIESIEPRQNRKRGDDFSDIEYIQQTDPFIERERKRKILQDLAQKL